MADLTTPLAEHEIDRLSDFLDSLQSPDAMNIERLDGFLCALIAGPDTVMPSEYLPKVLGAEASNAPSFDSVEQAQDILNLLTRHSNMIATSLRDGEIYLPILLTDADKVSRGNEWAKGFVAGMDMRGSSWRSFLSDAEEVTAIAPVFALAHENHPDPALRFASLTSEHRQEMLQLLPASLHGVYRYFAKRRGVRVNQPGLRTQPKVGRNDLCSCGSGKKYKHCCVRKVH